MEKLKFIKATAFPDKNNSSSVYLQPIEILVPIEAIACLQKNASDHNSYDVKFKTSYPLSLNFPVSSIQATLSISKIEIL